MAIYYESYYGVSSLGSNDYLMHHGIKGMKWGVRRYQNADGSLTGAGRARYGVGEALKKGTKAIGAGAKKAYGKAKHAYVTIDRLLAKRATRAGDIDSFLRHTKNLSESELKESLNHLDTLQKVDNIRAQKQKNAYDRMMRAVSTVKTAAEAGAAVGKGIKKFANFINDESDADKLYKQNRDKQVDSVAGQARKKAIDDAKKEGREATRGEIEAAAYKAVKELTSNSKSMKQAHDHSPVSDKVRDWWNDGSDTRSQIRNDMKTTVDDLGDRITSKLNQMAEDKLKKKMSSIANKSEYVWD